MLWDIFEDRAGNLWITTENGGLNRFDYQTGTFITFQHNPNDPYSLSSNDVFWMCEDRSGVIWITSRYGGVNLLIPALQRFTHYRNIPGNSNTIGENNIYASLAEENGDLWHRRTGSAGKKRTLWPERRRTAPRRRPPR